MSEFNASKEADRLSKKTNLRKKKRYSISKLDKYKFEILALRAEGCTLKQIEIWLKEKRIKAAISTIQRWLKKNG